MDTITKFTIPGIGFLLTLAFGFWLSSAGRPYKSVLFNVHKLLALGAVIAFSVQLYRALGQSDVPVILIGWMVLAGAGILAVFISGGLMGIGRLNHQILRIIHNVGSFLIVISIAVTIYIVSGGSL
jgi:hypothetical protein